jgi:CTP:molybdopterin cytidylyltransferase MocA
VNARADEGQLSSLLAGLDAVDAGADAVLVTLVDLPLVRAATVAALLARASRTPASAVRAAYRGRHGHPVIFKRALFAPLRLADPGAGAKAVLRAIAVEDVDADDPGVVDDIDTPEDYGRSFGVDIDGPAARS